jgi:uncharacterized protein (DUF934 family)
MPLLDATGVVDHAPAELLGPDQLDAAPSDRAPDESLSLALPNDADVAALEPSFSAIGLIAVTFPAFGDGRGFSLAKQLRALGFKGRLRASGPLLPDQLLYAFACGFDEVEVPDTVFARHSADAWTAAAGRAGLHYQRGYARGSSILDRRRAAHAASTEARP